MPHVMMLPQWLLAFFRKLPNDLDADFELKIREGRVIKLRKIEDWDEQLFSRRFREGVRQGVAHAGAVTIDDARSPRK